MGTLPWSADKSFYVQRYGIGHSQFTLASKPDGSGIDFEIWCNGVQRLEVDVHYTGGITINRVDSHGDFNEDSPAPLLLLTLTGHRRGSGFLACNMIQVSQGEDVLLSENAHYSQYGVGGELCVNGETAFGRPRVRKFSRTKYEDYKRRLGLLP